MSLAPDSGADVFVPAEDPTDRTHWMALGGAIAQILASMVAIIVVVTQ